MGRNYIEFSVTKERKFLGRNFYKIAFIGLLIIAIAESIALYSAYFANPALAFPLPIFTFVIGLPLILFLCLLFYITNRKAAQCLRFNLLESQIEIIMLLGHKKYVYDLDRVNIVNINFELSLLFDDGRNIVFLAPKELIYFLTEKKIPIKWGFFGKQYYKRIYNL